MQIPQSMTNTDSEQLPAELTELMAEMKLAKLAKVESLGKSVAAKRDEAVRGRKVSGIEKIWEEDEEYYQGVDDANRDSAPWIKSPSSVGGLSRKQTASATRCTSFFNITRQFCDSASARMGDILLPAGDWNFLIKPTPVPDEQAAPNQPAPTGMTAPPGVPVPAVPPSPEVSEQQPEMPAAPVAEQTTPASKAQKQAELAEKKIQDWLVECHYHTEVRKTIEDGSILGVGILKGPIPAKRKDKKLVEADGEMSLEMRVSTNPISKNVDPRDFFPDPSCGDDVHSGSFVFERDRLTVRQLRDLKGVKGYLDDQIDKVLDEGPGKSHSSEGGYKINTEDMSKDDDRFEVWYFYGLVDTADLCAMNVALNEAESSKNMVPAVVTLVNDTPIKAFINPLDSGEFPYDVMPWQRMAGSWAGIGVSRQMRTAQSMLNASARAMMDNAGLSSGPMLIVRQNAIIPADGKWEITARKVWWATEQADIRSTADAFTAINIPTMQAELMAIITLAKQMAEEATGMFFLMQGQQGSAPDTVGGMQLLHQNASTVLRRLARVFDERITEPHIRRYYEWLLIHGPDECKGDMQIQAVGSTAMVEREIQALQSMQVLNLSVNPAFGLDPAKAMVETLKSLRFIPERWTMDEETKAQQQPPLIPQVEAAKITAAQDDKRIEMEKWKMKVATTAGLRKLEVDVDRDRAYNDSIAIRDEMTSNTRMEELRVRRELALMDYANRHNMTLEQIKGKLADSAMKLRVQKELARTSAVARQVSTPPTEPPQHAQDGHAYEQ